MTTFYNKTIIHLKYIIALMNVWENKKCIFVFQIHRYVKCIYACSVAKLLCFEIASV